MRKLVIAFLSIVLVAGALLAPAYAQSPMTCIGENKRFCYGESQAGDGYLRLMNSSGFGVYIWVNPQITAVPADSEALGNVQLLMIAHTTAVETGAAFPWVNYGTPDLSIHGVRMSYTHECTVGADCS